MPFPHWLARFNLHFTNRLLSPFARRLSGMGIGLHIGRKTHRQYRTPVMVFRRGNHVLITLTYGRESEWVRNVLAANGCELESTKQNLSLSSPRLFHDERRWNMPTIVRLFLGFLNVSDFLELTIVHDTASQ